MDERTIYPKDIKTPTKSKVSLCPLCGAVVMIATLPRAEVDRKVINDFLKLSQLGFPTSYIETEDFRRGKYEFGHIPTCRYFNDDTERRGAENDARS